ncbi:Na(+)/H(+) antiporter subunit F1 [Paenibacillus sp. MB22_1]|uniref:Na(+)/H(+) antiporter subunit F1 n=1 Tax=unclassified Paenibacillus TaxID=185978 RepID=UPI0001AFCE32|nr:MULTISPECIES: Na(+)/H(+) antiporter subunit F1 [unclassified Paenibacillus]EES73240.1 Na(+)/H(+) antiporter subunit F [Paenibacillus sp. oral taxon 786 str. D14]MCT2197225.1 Na(+)/H(+) antiporter subunit F1 [Paenibacillus sp. p3-SID1389]
MMSTFLYLALGILSLSIFGCLFRLLKGPSLPDRIMSLDSIGINMLAMIAVFSMFQQTKAYIDIILLIGILTFIGTASLARFIERGIVFEDGDHENR